MKRLVCLAVFVLGAALSPGCRSEQGPPAAPAAATRKLAVVHPAKGSISRTITLPGSVRAYQEATLYAKVAGYLRSITVDKGDTVRAGDLLATIEVPELEADLAKGTAEMDEADRDFRRIGDAHASAPNLVVPKTVDEARAKAATTRASVERLRTLLGYGRITAPFAGVVSRRWVDPGAFIAAATATSAPSNSAVVTLSDVGRVRVEVAVPESEVRFIANGVPADFSVEGLPGKSFHGEVTRFSHVLDDTTRTMLTEIEHDSEDGSLRPGMYASVRLAVERHDGALLVPLDALLREKAKTWVFTADGGKAHKIPVRIGFTDEKNAEILDGVDAASTVLVVGKQPPADGETIEVAEAK